MKSWSLELGKLAGIKVYIHWTFWIIIAWVFLMQLQSGQGMEQAIWGVLFIFSLFACVVLHEFGHALTARRFGVLTKDITLYPIGGIASLEKIPEKPGQELLVAIAGPAVNIVIAGFLWVYLSYSGQMLDMEAIKATKNAFEAPFLWGLFIANATLAIFNLIPAFPMDGGRALRAFLTFFIDRTQATRIAASLGQFLAIIFVFLGFFFNFWLVFIGLFIYLGAGGEAAFEKTKSLLSGLRVKDALIRRFTVLRENDSLEKAVELLLNSQETEFLVLEGTRPVGLLSRNEIIKGLSEKGKETSISGFMNRDFSVVSSEMKLQEFFERILAKGQNVALVMEGNSILGLIDRNNIEETLLIQGALKRSIS